MILAKRVAARKQCPCGNFDFSFYRSPGLGLRRSRSRSRSRRRRKTNLLFHRLAGFYPRLESAGQTVELGEIEAAEFPARSGAAHTGDDAVEFTGHEHPFYWLVGSPRRIS